MWPPWVSKVNRQDTWAGCIGYSLETMLKVSRPHNRTFIFYILSLIFYFAIFFDIKEKGVIGESSKKLASNILKAELVKRGLKFQELHEKLEKIGIITSYNTMRLKINRGTFSFAFFLDCMKAIGVKSINLSDYFEES
jgi:Domain of unknown function (DUF6471)